MIIIIKYLYSIDSKSSHSFKKAIYSITDCFDNVFLSTRTERIVYASFERLQADLNCMNDLNTPNFTHPNLAIKNHSIFKNWKYLLNLASTEFPLRTNYELVRLLSLFNGANDIEVISQNFPKDRIRKRWIIKKKPSGKEYLQMTKENKTSVPHNFTIVKGIAYCSFSRRFIDYALNSLYSRNLLDWAKDTYSPDEWFWATLNYNVQFNPPGGFRGNTFKV